MIEGTTTRQQTRRMAYVALQTTRPGQGGYAHVHRIIENLTGLGWEVELLDPKVDRGPGFNGALGKLREWSQIRKDLSSRLERTDVVYVRDHPAALSVMRLAKRRGVPTVLEINGGYGELSSQYGALRAARGAFERSARARVRSASLVIAVAGNLAEWANAQGPERPARVVPNGADTAVFSPEAARPTAGVEGEYVVFVGSLAPWHGIPTLLEAAHSSEWPRGLRLVIAGSGQDQEHVEAAANALEHVTYLGRVSGDAVPGLVAGSIAALSTQTSRSGYAAGSPVKVYEALSCGVPVICSDFIEVAREISSEGMGLVFPSDDTRALLRCLAQVDSDKGAAQEMGRRAREFAVENYDWAKRAEQTDRLIATLLQARNG